MRSPLRPRPAVPSDHDTFLRLFVELATGDPLPPRDRWEESILPTTLFYEDAEGQVVAYSFHQIHGETGYVRHVVVDPAHRAKRLGRAVMDSLASVFREAGCTRWCLNVKPDNTPAIRLYEGVGMKRAYASTALRILWTEVEALLPASRELTAREVDPTDDAALEAAFNLPAGTLADQRKHRLVVRLLDPSSPAQARVGLACFDPQFPGAFPFRAAQPSFARPLLLGLKPHALPEHDHVNLVVEDDAALTAYLRAHGATVRLEILHYRGPLPAEPTAS